MTKLTNGNQVTHDEIARYAYLLREEDGKPEGHDVEYWVKAETLLYIEQEQQELNTVRRPALL